MSSTGRRSTRTRAGKAIDKAELVNRLVHGIEQKLEKGELKATLGDFIRLLQLQKELENEQPKEIEVRWVDPSEPAGANDE
ncbi:MAG: hypothetical protein HY822_08535 [Acidobacteria bacterium]|nr:hypothetical protein [Acidobacteriota bacterium]